MTTLDITSYKVKGKELLELIDQAVRDTQKVILRPLPDRIIMTKDQFDDLAKIIKLPDMHNSKERMLITRYNVMEIDVKDKHI